MKPIYKDALETVEAMRDAGNDHAANALLITVRHWISGRVSTNALAIMIHGAKSAISEFQHDLLNA